MFIIICTSEVSSEANSTNLEFTMNTWQEQEQDQHGECCEGTLESVRLGQLGMAQLIVNMWLTQYPWQFDYTTIAYT